MAHCELGLLVSWSSLYTGFIGELGAGFIGELGLIGKLELIDEKGSLVRRSSL